MNGKLSTKRFYGLDLVSATRGEWVEELERLVEQQRLTVVMTPNPEQLVRARRDGGFYRMLRQADVLLPDGEGLVWAARVVERLAGLETVEELLRIARERKLKVLLIGGRYGEKRERRGYCLTRGTPVAGCDKIEFGQNVIYYKMGYQNVGQIAQNETNSVERLIAELKPEVVLVALGAPVQEKWLVEERECLKKNGVRVAMAVGGSFDVLLGELPRAPAGWRRARLEWLWRLKQEPWRWRRMLALPRFVWWTWRGEWRKK
jgi:N-acetylglucosaminyldiphosphoundecaprenol N-acetyl-beta-D-mannosaminyltransferase